MAVKTAKKSTRAQKTAEPDVIEAKVKEKPLKKKELKAMRPLLYDGRVFKTGETVPFMDAKVDAWIKDGSAAWV